MTKIKYFKEINLQGISKNTLILLDLDDTTFNSCSDWGDSKKFRDMVTEHMLDHGSNVDQARNDEDLYNRWINSQSKVRTKLVDWNFIEFLEKAKELGAIAIGFTARRPVIADATTNQLSRHKVVFTDLKDFSFSETYKRKDGECKAEYTNKVLYCHDINPKGEVFKDFFKKFKEYCDKQKILVPEEILFVDDMEDNIKSMELACKDLNLKYYGYHFQPVCYKFDAKNAKWEEENKKERPRSLRLPEDPGWLLKEKERRSKENIVYHRN